jgi:hypothetical protein
MYAKRKEPPAKAGGSIISGSPYGIRTRDLRLERAVSLAARRRGLVAGDPGFEPGLTDSESAVLPLNESPPTSQFYQALSVAHIIGSANIVESASDRGHPEPRLTESSPNLSRIWSSVDDRAESSETIESSSDS